MLNQSEILELSKSNIILPFEPNSLKPASYTFRLGGKTEQTIIKPREFKVLQSLEQINFPNNLVGQLSTRGSIAKLGLDCLLTDTVIEPGSIGHLSFCTKNNSTEPVILKLGEPIVKCIFTLIN